MKYLFSNEALCAMQVGIASLQETPKVRELYDKLRKARGTFITHRLDYSPEELALIKQALGKGNGTIGDWGYKAREEIAQIS